MTKSISDDVFGAWVLKCNPKTWDLEGFLADGERHIDSWSVQKNYRAERMGPGDPVVFWVTGAPNAAVAPGVWGVGYVTAPVDLELEVIEDPADAEEDVPLEDESAQAEDVRSGPRAGDPQDQDEDEDDDADGYWLDLDALEAVRFFVGVDLRLFDDAVPRDQIQSTPTLAGMELLKQPQMSNPSWLTKQEWVAMQGLLGDDAFRPPDAATVAVLNAEAEVRHPDPVTRQAIELTSISYVREHLESDGWQIDDLQSAKVGWDLTANRGPEVRHVEVKGCGLSRPDVLLTANEMRAAQDQAGWELAVVTSALDNPHLEWYPATRVVQVARPVTFRAVFG